jgi:hypothetical protein
MKTDVSDVSAYFADAERIPSLRSLPLAQRPGRRSAVPIRFPMDRSAVHEFAKARVAARLRLMGLTVQTTRPASGSDFIVNQKLRIALRAALLSTHQRKVRQGVRLRRYRYHHWCFNFHRHGQVRTRYCDVFICLPLVPGEQPDLQDAVLIPWEARSGKMFYLHRGKRPYRGKYACYRNAWTELRHWGTSAEAIAVPTRDSAA